MIPSPLRVLELRSVWGTGGGPEKTILLGAAQSDPAKYLVTVCYLRDERDSVFGPAAKAHGLPIDYVEISERHSLDLGVWRKLHRLVRERRIDIVHAHDYKTNLLALLLSWTDGVIPMSTAHGWTGHTRREKIYYFADKRLLRMFPLVIAVSSEIRKELLRCGAATERITVVLNGIDPQTFRRDPNREAKARHQLGLPRDRTIIGSVGRLEPQKRFDLLIEAFSQLHQSHPHLFLAIAGEGSLRAELEGKARQLQLDGSYALLGHQSDVALVHHTFDIFVQSSMYEGTPNAVLEAMALESPIVATDVGGTKELVRHDLDGLIVPPDNLKALRISIESILLDSTVAKRRAAAARRRVENELSFKIRMGRVEALYDELMKRSSL